MPWSYYGSGLYLGQINCRCNNVHVPCPRDVAWILFILVVMERFNGIIKDSHADVYPMDWRFWIPEKTHNTVLILQVMSSYFPTVIITEGTTFILYPASFLLETVTNQLNILVNILEWGFTSPEYMGSKILHCVKPPQHPVYLI